MKRPTKEIEFKVYENEEIIAAGMPYITDKEYKKIMAILESEEFTDDNK